MQECARFPGFVTKFRASNSSSAESSDHVDYENFRHVCHKWHYKITKCVIVCLESKDYIQIRNSLIVLKEILPHFPKVTNLAAAVERWIERVRMEEKDKRQDLFALATSYIGQLKARWSTLVAEDEFHEKVSNPEKPVKVKAVKEEKDGGKEASSTSKEGTAKETKSSKSASSAVKGDAMEVTSTGGDGPTSTSSSKGAAATADSTNSNNQSSGSTGGGGGGKSSKQAGDSAASSPIVV